MIYRRRVLDSPSQLSYLVGDGISGRALMVYPHCGMAVYRQDTEEFGLRVERVIDARCHADFLSGHFELTAAGAVTCYVGGSVTDDPIAPLHDGQRLEPGEVTLLIRFATQPPARSLTWGNLSAPRSFVDSTARRAAGVVALDTREPSDIALGHLRGSANISLEGRFAECVGGVGRRRAAYRSWMSTAPAIGRHAPTRPDRGRRPSGLPRQPAGRDHRACRGDRARYAAHGRGAEATLGRHIRIGADRRVQTRRTRRQRDPVRRTSPIGPAGATGRGIGLIRSVTVYSAEGRRSVIAARWLTTTGFADVSDLSGSHDARAALQVPGPVPAL